MCLLASLGCSGRGTFRTAREPEAFYTRPLAWRMLSRFRTRASAADTSARVSVNSDACLRKAFFSPSISDTSARSRESIASMIFTQSSLSSTGALYVLYASQLLAGCHPTRWRPLGQPNVSSGCRPLPLSMVQNFQPSTSWPAAAAAASGPSCRRPLTLRP